MYDERTVRRKVLGVTDDDPDSRLQTAFRGMLHVNQHQVVHGQLSPSMTERTHGMLAWVTSSSLSYRTQREQLSGLLNQSHVVRRRAYEELVHHRCDDVRKLRPCRWQGAGLDVTENVHLAAVLIIPAELCNENSK